MSIAAHVAYAESRMYAIGYFAPGASRCSSWVYRGIGAAEREEVPGLIEGWSFAGNRMVVNGV